jgi:cysteine desulfurase
MPIDKDYIYLDNAASTRTDPEVVKAMLPFFTEVYAVASSQFSHQPGIEASEAMNAARESVAKRFGVKSDEVVFTSDAAESNNLAIKGFAFANRQKGDHIITSATEVYSVLNSCRSLEEHGFRITVLPVDREGLVDPEALAKAVTDRTILVSIQWANQETGTLQRIEELAGICRARGVAFHTDASYAAGRIGMDLSLLPVDMLTFTGALIHGPKGIAALIRRKGVKLKKLTDGGFNEFDLRPGVENIPGIAGLAKALEVMTPDRIAKVAALDRRLFEGLKGIEGSALNGSATRRIPGILNVSYDRVEGESVILHLDMKGVAVITGSACFSRSLEPSYVLMSMGHTHERAHGSIRYSLSHENTEEQMDRVVAATREVVERLRKITPVKK